MVEASNKLTSKGNLRSKSTTNKIILEKRVDEVYRYWSKQSFPYYETSNKYRNEQFDKFLRTNDQSSFDFSNRILKFNNSGLSLCWSYFKHAFEVRCNNLNSPIDVFNSERLFKNGIRKVLTGTFFTKKSVSELCNQTPQAKQSIYTILRRITGTQMVSNFRPVTASMIYKIFCDSGDVVWDMSSGWGGRLLGSIKSKINYIGTDPSSKTIKGNKELAKQFGNKNYSYTLHQCGSEEFEPDRNSLDFAFTSPPYFDTEQYSNEQTQSYLKFKSVLKWKSKFLRQTIKNVHRGLKQNKFMGLNVADVKNYSTFERDTIEIAEEIGFKYLDRFDYALGSQHDNFKTEPIFIFKKI